MFYHVVVDEFVNDGLDEMASLVGHDLQEAAEPGYYVLVDEVGRNHGSVGA